jgi:glucose-6-phosphate 1-dehydrogenase
MEPPTSMYFESLHNEQAKVFHMIPSLDPAHLVRGQFRGYLSEPGVAPESQVETFAAVRLEVDSWRWVGVPFLVRTGKCLPVTATEVFVKLKKPPLGGLDQEANYFGFRLGPDLSISIGARVKRPGAEMVSMPSELSAVKQNRSEELDAYERLLTDAMHGDNMLFVREDVVEAAWSIVEPILGNVAPLREYDPGTWGPAEADQLAADVGGWHNPEEAR